MMNSGVLSPDEIRELFEDKNTRMNFIRNVFTILTLQLAFTFTLVFIGSTNNEVKQFLMQNPYLLYVAMGMTLGITCLMGCFEKARRVAPFNYICLVLFTIFETILVMFLTIHFKTKMILIAFGITAGICLAATIIACFTKWDFTSSKFMCIMIIVTLVLSVVGLVLIFFHTPILMLIYGAAGALIFTIWLIIDIQLMIGGKHQNRIEPEDYCFAALSIYVDVLVIFQFILYIMQGLDN